MAKLFVVGTPIGNLSDISARALKTLSDADFIAAEDTRVTAKLLAAYDIHKPMVSYFEHNIRQRGDEIIARILDGQNCALVTDAGMPCISDPGEDLIRLCAQNAIDTVVIPGPSALVSALALSALPTGRFAFEGFLCVNARNRREHLDSIKNDAHTLIFYEAPHKLRQTLADLLAALGDRRITIARELTKIHEETLHLTLSTAISFFEDTAPRGEFVLVIEGAPPAAPEEISFDDAVNLLRLRSQNGEPLSLCAKDVALLSGYKKSELYRAVAALQNYSTEFK